MADIFVNDVYVGKVEDALKFVKGFKEKRRSGEVDNSYGIYYNDVLDTVFIDNTPGKVRRPLIVVDNGIPRLTDEVVAKIRSGEWRFKDLLKNGIVEYVDAAEEENCLVALTEEDLTPEHTHLEISPLLMFGFIVGMIPYLEYDEGSRIMRGMKALRQGVGIYSKNYLNSFQTDRNVIVYVQKPIVKTFINDLFNYQDHSVGMNVVVAVMSFEGYNMEDGLIMNQSSVERGLFRTYYFKLYETFENKYPGGLVDKIMIPPKDVKGYLSEEDYRYLEEDGIISVGQRVKEGDVLIGKISPPRFIEEIEGFGQFFNINVDSSIVVKENEGGVVSNVVVYEDEEGNKSVSVLVRDHRLPLVGDKFETRHGQKGVVGIMYKQSDMPFSENGIIPDVIFSPHSIPSRKTVGHILEIIAGKVAALQGEQIDGTPFDNAKEEDLREILESYGLRSDGTEVMYDPKTGKRIEAEIYIGSIYYSRLKHQVLNKVQARSTGPVQLLTRQPTEGRVRGGGLRLGEMEKDVMIAHGASLLLKERFSSDQTTALVCRNCGYLADPHFLEYNTKCPFCGGTKFDKIELAYAFKLFVNELRSLGIKIDFEVKDRFFDSSSVLLNEFGLENNEKKEITKNDTTKVSVKDESNENGESKEETKKEDN